MTQLKTLSVNEEVFNQLLETYASDIEIKENIGQYYTGYYKDKDKIYYDGHDTLICLEYLAYYVIDPTIKSTTWKQLIIQKNEAMDIRVEEAVRGARAKAEINKLLKKAGYTQKEIKERLLMFQAEYDEGLKQFHYMFPTEFYPENTVIKVTNTYKFDINGAHLAALCEIFPKAEQPLKEMYDKRKQSPRFKQYPNLYIGTLAQKTKEMRALGIEGPYERTYNWIVQRTTKTLYNAMDYVGGTLIYANTDGFVVKDPTKLLETSKELGKFKLEYQGDTYVYADKNYLLYQFGDELKGSAIKAARDNIDLSKGEVVHYTTKTKNKILDTMQKEKVSIYEY